MSTTTTARRTAIVASRTILPAKTVKKAISRDFLERDGKTFVYQTKEGRTGWEKTLAPDSAYSEELLSLETIDARCRDEAIIRKAYDIASRLVDAMDVPGKVRILLNPSNDDSYTNSKSIVVSTKMFDEKGLDLPHKLDIFLGCTEHEALHCEFTDFDLRITDRMIHDLFNIIEDERIEHKAGDKYPGLANYLKEFKYYYQQVFKQRSLAEVKKKGIEIPYSVRLFNAILGLIRYPSALSDEELSEFGHCLIRVHKLMEDFPQSSADALKKAIEILEIVKEESLSVALPPTPKSSSSSEDEQGESGDGEDGEGDGESDGEGQSSDDGDGKGGKSGKSDKSSDPDKDSEDSEKPSGKSGKKSDKTKDKSEGSGDGTDKSEKDSGGKEKNSADSANSGDDSGKSGDNSGNSGDNSDSSEDGSSLKGGSGSSKSGKSGSEDGSEGESGDNSEDMVQQLREATEKEREKFMEDFAKALREYEQAVEAKELSQFVENHSEIDDLCTGTGEYGSTTNILVKKMKVAPDDSRSSHFETIYRRSLERVRPYIPAMKTILQANGTKFAYQLRGCRSGKLDGGKLAQAYIGSDNVFNQLKEVKANKVAVAILIDESGSMACANGSSRVSRIDAARDTAILLNEALGSLPNVDLFIYGHTADERTDVYNDIEILTYRDHFVRDKFALGQVKARSDNADGYAILEVANKVRKQTKEPVLFFVISDGMPAANIYNLWGQGVSHTRECVEKVTQMGFQPIQIAISPEFEPRTMFKHYVTLEALDKLPQALSLIIRDSVLKNTRRH